MNKEEHIRVITDKEELYDKCDNMEQLYDKYYLPLLCKHYDTIYKLQQETKQLKDNWNKMKEYIKEDGISYLDFAGNRCFCNKHNAQLILDKMQELEEK